MKVAHVHRGLMSTWEVTFEKEKKKLKRNRHEGILVLEIMKCRSVLNEHVLELSWQGNRSHLIKRVHIYEENVRKLNRLLRDYRFWYSRTQK